MALSPEEVQELKGQLREQVSHLPPDRKQQALDQIEALTPQALEQMVQQQRSQSQKPVFRMIVDKEIPSVQIDENEWAIAVLDIAPISKGHVVIIPKTAVTDPKDLAKSIIDLSKDIAKRIEKKLNTKDVQVASEIKFGECILNVIPVYDVPLTLNSQRSKTTVEELEKIAPLLKKTEKKPKIEKIKIEKANSKDPILKIPRRIP